MNQIITIIQIIISVILIGLILLQAQGGGLGSAFGDSSHYYSKRGMEKSIFYITIFISAVFFITSILNFIL